MYQFSFAKSPYFNEIPHNIPVLGREILTAKRKLGRNLSRHDYP